MSNSWLDFAEDNDDIMDECTCNPKDHYSMRPKAAAGYFQRVPGNSLLINRSCHFTVIPNMHDKKKSLLNTSFSAPQLEIAEMLSH